MKIKDWAEEDRPREKLIAKGIDALSNAELLAILFRSGTTTQTAVALAQEVLSRCDNSLVRLGRMSLRDLQQFGGIGETKAASLIAALELGRRRAQSDCLTDDYSITDSTKIFHYFHARLADLSYEELWALYVSRGAKILHTQRISSGGTSSAEADVKMIVLPALQHMASSVALCHNHPHGKARPSEADKKVTTQVREALRLFDLRLLDHIIIADDTYYSFADEGAL